MSRKRVLIHAVTWTTLVTFIVVVGSSSHTINADPASEVRSSGGSSVSFARPPTYQKPAPYKPKLVLAKQLQLHSVSNSGGGKSDNRENPHLTTQTVYGFLDFTTTVGNTVMIFTPQTKQVELIEPSSTRATSISPTATTEASTPARSSDAEEVTQSFTTARQPKLIPMDTYEVEEDGDSSQKENVSTQLESSETEVVPAQQTTTSTTQHATFVINATPFQSSLGSTATTTNVAESSTPDPSVEVRTQVNVVSSADDQTGTTTTTLPTTTTPKGFTLKLTSKLTTPSSVYSNSSVVTALPVVVAGKKTVLDKLKKNNGSSSVNVYAQPVPSATSFLLNKKFAQVTAQVVLPDQGDGGSSTSTSTSTTAPSTSTTGRHKPQVEVRTEQSVQLSSSGGIKEDGEGNQQTRHEEVEEEEEGEEQLQDENPLEEEDASEAEEEIHVKPTLPLVLVEPTPTKSADEQSQTLYVLPQKNSKDAPAEIYVSPSPAPDSYSRQPQLYVDIASPAKPTEYVVTATPTSGFGGRNKFRQQATAAGPQGTQGDYVNRFSNRFSRKQRPTAAAPSSTESNELTQNSYEQTNQEETTSSRSRGSNSGASRFRTRNRKTAQVIEDVQPQPTAASTIYSHTVTATPSASTRRFAGGRSRGNKNYQEQPSNNNGNSGSAYKSRGNSGFSPSRSKGAAAAIIPTTSSSIYRFKLNRPTGRWRFKPSPKPKVSIIKSKDEESVTAQPPGDGEDERNGGSPRDRELLQQQSINGVVYSQQQYGPENYQYGNGGYNGEDDDGGVAGAARVESNELAQENDNDSSTQLLPQTIRVATITPTEFSDLDKYLEIATIKSPYVFQAGNVKNTRYITVTKTFTKDMIQPTQTLEAHETLENILATRAPYERILEGSNDVATLPVVVLGEEMATPPLETVTQTFSTTQLMLKTSILPAVYDGVTTLYTLTQSYFVTRLVTAHKTVPPMELFQFVPTKSLTEFNTALQEAESEHREQLLGSESDDENETHYQQIVAAPDELKLVGSEFDLSFMDEKIPKGGGAENAQSKSLKSLPLKKSPVVPASTIPDLSNLTPEQLAFFRFLTANQQAAAAAQQQQQQVAMAPSPLLPNFFQSPIIPSLPQQIQPYQLSSSPIVIDTVTTIVETKTLRILFGAKPTQTTLFSTRVVPTRVTTYIASQPTATVPTAAAAVGPQIPNFFQAAAGGYPLAAFVG